MLKHQQGVGLLEVLVALLLLSVAVLGFSAMQMRAIKATDETLIRSDAMMVIRNVSEDLRLYPNTTQRQAYITALSSGNSAVGTDCRTTACTEAEQVAYTAAQSLQIAEDSELRISAQVCPGSGANNLTRMCVIAAWGDTQATMGDDANTCTTAEGAYKPGAKCFIMETY
ncbi:MAG: type IV pilus modification protein PilV [Moraxella sp.]|nr:type IV pilus modification protein PilV [Moraxella sp.]